MRNIFAYLARKGNFFSKNEAGIARKFFAKE